MTTKNLQYESGRSMVEMLGTLAIIGVLSVGGIAGYSYGMDKYRANQTINDVMLMGVDIITQTSRGAVPTLSEWGTKTTAGYDFSVKPNPTDATKYGIVVDGVPSRVCQMVGDALKTQATVYVGNVDYTTANTNPCEASEENTMKFYFDTSSASSNGGDQCKIDTDCGEGNYCDNGWCFSGDKPVFSYGGETCITDTDCGDAECAHCYEGKCSVSGNHNYPCNNQKGICNWGRCIEEACSPTNPCADKSKYCASPNTSCTEEFPSGSSGICITPDFTLHKINNKSYYISNTYMSWWHADEACRLLGREGLISVEELVKNWPNGSGALELTELGKELDKLIDDHVWTSNYYSDCTPYSVRLMPSNKSVAPYREHNHHGEHFAVCK